MLLHAVAVFISLVAATFVVEHFWLHTAFCVTMLGSAVWNASSQYNYFLLHAYTKRLRQKMSEEDEGSGSEAAGGRTTKKTE